MEQNALSMAEIITALIISLNAAMTLYCHFKGNQCIALAFFVNYFAGMILFTNL